MRALPHSALLAVAAVLLGAASLAAQKGAASGPHPDLRAEVDLRPRFAELGLGLDSQNRRATCAVFALVSAVEFAHAQKANRGTRLSQEFVIWAVRAKDDPQAGFGRGFVMTQVARRLSLDGVPSDAAYLAAMRGDFTRVPPPAIVEEARRNLRAVRLVPAKTRSDLLLQAVRALNQGSPLALGCDWPNDATLRRNATLDQQAAPEAHAVLLVGYRCPTGRPEDVTFIFRNSWGRQWGNGGHGFMTARYFLTHAHEAYSVHD